MIFEEQPRQLGRQALFGDAQHAQHDRAAWREGAEVVRAVRRTRAERGLRRAGFDLFHLFYARLIDYPVEPNSGTFGLLGRAAVAAFNDLPERNRFFPGLRAWLGFPTATVLYDRQERAAGQPQQTLRRLVRYALDGLFSFSYLPLRVLTYCGVGIALLGFVAAVFYATRRIMGHADHSISDTYRERFPDDRLKRVVEYVHAWLYPRPTVLE